MRYPGAVPSRRSRPGRLTARSAAGAILALCVVSVAFGLALLPARSVCAQPALAPSSVETEITAQSTDVPDLGNAPDLQGLQGKPITRVEIVTLGGRWPSSARVVSVRPGEPLSLEAARRAARELLTTGAFARTSVEAVPEGGGAVLRVLALPRRIIATIQMSGGALDPAETLEVAGVARGGEITAPMLPSIGSKISAFYARHGFPSASVRADTTDTDDPRKVVLAIQINAGKPRMIARRIFVIEPAADREVGDLKRGYRLGTGARADEPALAEADRELAETLQKNGFLRATVNHEVRNVDGRADLYVNLTPGPRIVPAFDGNHAFDDDQLVAALALDTALDTRPAELADRLTSFYVARGFYDVEITPTERGKPDDPVHYLVFSIRENQRVRVTHRVFPCLSGPMSPDQVGREIESFLEEDLPGAETFSTPDPRAVVDLFGPTQGAGNRALPLPLNPAMTLAPDTYDRALKHLRDLFHSQGYLNAVVGPVSIVRATCGRRSTPGACVPEPPKERVQARCLKDPLGLPLPEPPLPDALTCRPDPKRGVTCSPDITLRIPIHLGPQTTLYDLAFEGNRSFSDKRLAEVAELAVGQPLSNVELDSARLRVLDEYRTLGFAYAEVRTTIEPSPDRTRARARFVVTERDLVTVTDFVVRGNVNTEQALILGRLALQRNQPYRQDWVRTSEERIATLGTFSSVSVGLEDPEVPQRNKRVVITVAEQPSQYLDPRIGFSTGEGFRFAFEYGHRNIGGQAIALTIRVQLSYLFEFIILDPTVRENYAFMPISNRLERRNTVSVALPEIGLGPGVSLSIDGIDVRDNQRDFGLTKQALIPTLSYRQSFTDTAVRDLRTKLSLPPFLLPRMSFAVQGGASAELNEVQIFKCLREKTEEACSERSERTIESLLLAPKGRTLAFAQQANVSIDARDNAFSATRGFFASAGIEHVNAFPSEVFGNPAKFDSHFLRLTGRTAFYFPLTKKGTSLAMSLAAGYNIQLNSESRTYPDRLFFMGGVDSLRAFLSDSVVPEDVAQRILKGEVLPNSSPPQRITIDDVRIRGGDLALNPRIELRIPLNETFHAGVFLDTGNLWVEPVSFDPFALRYAGGAGLRIVTPIGPLALDYGINLLRRSWEDFGAFHFSIGLF